MPAAESAVLRHFPALARLLLGEEQLLRGDGETEEEEMIAMSRIGQKIAAGLAALILTATTVGAAVGTAHNGMPRGTVAAPASLVAAQLSGQA
jgi:hypothetical protein